MDRTNFERIEIFPKITVRSEKTQTGVIRSFETRIRLKDENGFFFRVEERGFAINQEELPISKMEYHEMIEKFLEGCYLTLLYGKEREREIMNTMSLMKISDLSPKEL